MLSPNRVASKLVPLYILFMHLCPNASIIIACREQTIPHLKIQIKPQYFSIGEQILLSAANMLASLAVVKTAGVSWFGIYSFMFTMAVLASGIFSTILHRQMLLIISTENQDEQAKRFIATLTIQTSIFLPVIAGCLALILLSPANSIAYQYQTEIIAVMLYLCVFNTFDLCRQYLYATDNQMLSFKYTCVYVATLVPALVLVLLFSPPIRAVATVFVALACCMALGLLSNRVFRSNLSRTNWQSWPYVWSTFVLFFSQGRYRLVGLFVTWAQNQSMNPFLLLVSGPLVAGYFSLARLMIMPMNVINQGLVNSTTPTLRRLFKNSTIEKLNEATASLSTKNLLFSLAYLLVLGILHISGVLESLVPDYNEVRWFLLLWIVATLITMHRFWIGQYFVVSMQFRYTMRIGILALLVSFSGMVLTGYILGNVYLAMAFISVGELITIILFLQRRRKDTLAQSFNN